MIIQRTTMMLSAVVLLSSSAIGKETTAKEASPTQIREVAVYLVLPPFSFLEAGALGVQYQLDDHYAIGLKLSAAYIGGKGFILPNAGLGGGFKLSYYFDKTGSPRYLNANAINFEASYLHPGIEKTAGRRYHATEIEITVGHDGIEGHGLGFLWAVGVAFSSATSVPPLFFPALKFGLHYDF